MGELAEDVICGLSCSGCGMYFQDPLDKDALYEHGFPVLCWDCWKEWNKRDIRASGLQRAQVKTVG